MFVVEKLKLNKFQLVKLPKNDLIFARFGNYVAPDSSYSGDEVLQPFVSKVEAIAQSIEDYEAYCSECDSKDA